jgi:hypothetical protein
MSIWASAQSTRYQQVVKQLYYQLQMVLVTSFIRYGLKGEQVIVGIQSNYIGQYTLKETKSGEIEQTQLLGEKMAAQECDCDFISSGYSVVDGELLTMVRRNSCFKSPLRKEDLMVTIGYGHNQIMVKRLCCSSGRCKR